MMTMLLKSILIFIFVVISISDWRTHKIPDRWNAGILLVAVLLALVDPSVSWQERILGMFAVSVPMACLLFFVPGSFGGGDIKLMAVCGLILGWPRVAAAGFLSVVTGGCYAIWLLATRRAGRSDHFAFGPFLAVGVVLSLLYGDQLLSWYLGFLR